MPTSATILLVDDSRFFLTIEKQFLRNTPATLIETQNAEQALDICRRQKPDLIYMACDLRGVSGIDCCRQLKNDPELSSIPVVLICEENRPEQLDHCRLAGSDGILSKPLDRHRFLEIGRSFLAGIRERRRLCLFRVRYRHGENLYAGKGLDISSGGLFLESSEPIAAGENLQLEIQLSRPEQAGPWIGCNGQVAWINTRENPLKPNRPAGLGIKFKQVPAGASAVLNGFLRSMDGG
ncbi:MAG TPA: response regulator [Desulfuromonadales bacterium]|jgi:CheY-like chemotaxis protein